MSDAPFQTGTLTPEPVFQNEHFVIVDKPPGWLSVPSRQGEEDARPCVGRWLESHLGCRIFPVHRLDECVTGLLLFAKNPQAHRSANGWFEKSVVGKEYEAFTAAENPPLAGSSFTWTSLLARGKKRAYVCERSGKRSVTEALCEGPARSSWLFWRLHPQTGRSHQLRFELARHGFSIVGDILYGSREPWVQDGIALRMRFLDFRPCPEAQRLGLPETLRATHGLHSLAKP